jgi:hypothetical protein
MDETWPGTSTCWSGKITLPLLSFPSDEHFDDEMLCIYMLHVDQSSMNIDDRFCGSSSITMTEETHEHPLSELDSPSDVWTDGSSSNGCNTIAENNADVRAEKHVSVSGCWEHTSMINQGLLKPAKDSDQFCQAACHETEPLLLADPELVTPLASPSLVLQVKPRVRRRKFGRGDKHSLGGRPIHIVNEGYLTPIAVTPEALRAYFDKPLHEAARSLGICATAVKKICRKMGIKEWPFQRIKPIRKRIAKLQSSTMTPDVLREVNKLQNQELALMQGLDLDCFKCHH